jgi:hypothetical protein
VVVLDDELGITRVLVEGRERVGPGEALAGTA